MSTKLSKAFLLLLLPSFFISLKSVGQACPGFIQISGKIKNEWGEGVPFASISAANRLYIADSAGNYKIYILSFSIKNGLLVSAAGYFNQNDTISLNNERTYYRNITLKVNNKLDNVGVTITCSLKRIECCRLYSICTRHYLPSKDTIIMHPSKFNLYPNPLPRGSILKIQWKQNETGSHKFQLFNLAGQVVFQKEIFINDKAGLLSIDLPSVIPGTYFIRIINKNSGKPYTEKIIVQ